MSIRSHHWLLVSCGPGFIRDHKLGPLHETPTRSRTWKVEITPPPCVPEAAALPASRLPVLVAPRVATPLQGVTLQPPTLHRPRSQHYAPHTGTLGPHNRQSVPPKDQMCSKTQHCQEPTSPHHRLDQTCRRKSSSTKAKERLVILCEITPQQGGLQPGQTGAHVCHLYQQIHLQPHHHTPSVALVGGLRVGRQLRSWLPWKDVGSGEAS